MRIFVCLLLLFIYRPLSAQDRALAALRELDQRFPREKLHLFLSADECVPGETIAFRCYAFSGYSLSRISTEAWVELYDRKGQRLRSVKIPLIGSGGQGSLTLPDSLPEGHYYLQASTRWMRNFPPMATSVYPIVVREERSKWQLQARPIRWEAGLFAESGTLLAGMPNKMVVRLSAKGRLPDHWRGDLVEIRDTSKVLLRFENENPQLASFIFSPEAGHSYQIRLQDEAGNRQSIPVSAQADGVVLNTVQDGRHLGVELLSNKSLPSRLYLLGQMQQQVVCRVEMTNKGRQAVIPIKSLKPGVLHLTLFNESEEVLAERLVFIRPATTTPSLRDARLISDSSSRLVLDLDTAGLQHYALQLRTDDPAKGTARSLLSDFWLGEFPSGIDRPHWYFEPGTDRFAVLDDLLITERWPLFRWDSLLAGVRPQINILPETYLQYKGKATVGGKPIVNEKLNLMLQFADRSRQYLQVQTDAGGSFAIGPVVFYDSVSILPIVEGTKRSKGDVLLDVWTSDTLSPIPIDLPFLADTLVARGSPTEKKRSVVDPSTPKGSMENVTVRTRSKTPKELLNEELSSDLFETPFNQYLIDFVNEEQNAGAYSSIFDWLDGRVPGLLFNIVSEPIEEPKTGDRIPAGSRVPIMRGDAVPLFIDEVPAAYNSVASLAISDIAMVKVIRGVFLGSWHSEHSNGALVIYTKRAKFRSRDQKQAVLARLAGYSLPAPPSNDRLLLWQPQLMTESKNHIQLNLTDPVPLKPARLVLVGWSSSFEPIYLERIIDRK